MSNTLRITLAQLDVLIGDIKGNTQLLIDTAIKARDELKADVIVFPELFITGYPAGDLLYRKAFLDQEAAAIQQILKEVTGIYCVFGHTQTTLEGLYNCGSVIYNGDILATHRKHCLPNNYVFDERRYFIPGAKPTIVDIKGIPVGIVVCEDLWHIGPVEKTVAQGAKMILSPNASPFAINRDNDRRDLLINKAKSTQVPIFYTNFNGAQDDLVFDGGSMVVDQHGEICAHAGQFKEKLLTVDCEYNLNISVKKLKLPEPLSLEHKVYDALVLGLKDYVNKNNFPGIILGLSGGIDSAVTLAIAVDALGADRVTTVMMPSEHTSDLSINEAKAQAELLGTEHHTISITDTYNAFLSSLEPQLITIDQENKNTPADSQVDTTKQNLQARIRGTMLMALSNKSGKLVITTGNRSELAMGYATLYGDMAGGFCVLKDVPKVQVYQLANYRNSISPAIPQAVIDRAPSAELAPDQKDEDNLPPYEILDEILQRSINQEQCVDKIAEAGFDRDLVKQVVNQVYNNEYKRCQGPLGVRLNTHAFGRDRRYPVTSGYREE